MIILEAAICNYGADELSDDVIRLVTCILTASLISTWCTSH